MADDINSIAGAILTDAKALLEAKATGFLAAHPEAAALLEKAAIHAATYRLALALESDPDRIEGLKRAIRNTTDTLKEEGYSIVWDVEAASKSIFLTLLEDAGRIAIGAAPALLKFVAV